MHIDQDKLSRKSLLCRSATLTLLYLRTQKTLRLYMVPQPFLRATKTFRLFVGTEQACWNVGGSLLN